MNQMPPIAFITGAGTGIGAATAELFAKAGWDLILVGRRTALLEATALKLQTAYDCTATAFTLDVTSPDSKQEAASWLKQNTKMAERISAVVHNAGIVERKGTLDSTDESWHRTFETNLFGVVRLTQALYPFLKLNKGAIVNVSSTLGLRPIPETAAYSASKAALINWTASFAKEAGADGVRVNCVCPGIIDTPIQTFHHAPNREALIEAMANLQPLGRIGKPEDVAHMIWALAGPGSEWTTGAVVTVDGGINLG